MAGKKKIKEEDILDNNEQVTGSEDFVETSQPDMNSEVLTLRNAAELLRQEIEQAEEKAREMEVLFAAIRDKRHRLRTINKVIVALTGERGEVRARRPNGANRQTVTSFLSKHPNSSVKAISESTGISIPSVRATLKGGGFAQDDSHKWGVD